METLRNVMGLGSTTTDSGAEPVNADQGAGTATEPFDGGNKEENVPEVTKDAAATTTEPSSTLPAGTSPTAAAVVSDGAEPAAEVPPAQAVGASATKTADELGETSSTKPVDSVTAGSTPATTGAVAGTTGAVAATTVDEKPTDTSAEPKTAAVNPVGPETPAKNTVDHEPVTALPSTKTETSPDAKAAAVAASSKEKSIGSPGWFKNTLQRRKSKGNPLDTEKGPAVPEKDTPKKHDSAALAAATAAAGTTGVAVAADRPKEVEKPKETVNTQTQPKKEHKRSKSVSETIKSVNPFKRRQSKAETNVEAKAAEKKPETIKEEKAAAVVLPPNHLSSDVPAGHAPPATADQVPPQSTAPAVSSEPAVAPAASRYADEEIAPDALPAGAAAATTVAATEKSSADVPSTTAATSTPAATDTVPATTISSTAPVVTETAPTTTSATPAANAAVADETPVKTSTVDESPVKSTAVAEPAAASSAAAAATVAAEEKPKATPADTKASLEPATSSTVPEIKEPSASAAGESKKGKASLVPTNHENLSAIPTAGGIRLGEKAMEERRASVDVRRKSFSPADVPVAETKPATASTATPAATPAATTAATPAVATTDKTAAETSDKDGVPSRRLSVFGKIKEKLKT